VLSSTSVSLIAGASPHAACFERAAWGPFLRALILSVAIGGCNEGLDLEANPVLWSATRYGGATGAPYVDQDLVVMGIAFSNRLVAVERSTGETVWETTLDLPESSVESGQLSPSLEIVRYGETLIVSSGWLYALNRATGMLEWSFQPYDDRPGRWAVIDGAQLFAGSKLVYSMDPATGDVLETFDVGEYTFAPVFSDGVLYLGTRAPGEPIGDVVPLGEGHAMALDTRTGELLWQHPVPDHPSEPWVGGVTSRGSLSEELFVVAGLNGIVYGLNRTTGALQWSHQGGGPYRASVTVTMNIVVVGGTNGDVEGLDLATGTTKWVDRGLSSISQIGQVDDIILVTNGRIRAFEAGGAELWGFGGAGWGQPTFGSRPSVWSDVLYANSVESGLFAIRFPIAAY